jgi:hypothetical protein
MRYGCVLALGVLLLFGTPHGAAAQASIEGFGGFTVDSLSVGEETQSLPLDFGGRVSFELVPGIQAFGEVGRMGNVLPSFVSMPLSLLPIDVGVSAFYGEGGVRLAAARAAVTPYVEASAGMARLSVNVGGLGLAGSTAVRTALSFLDTTEPTAGVGGGVMFRGGPVLVDLGYRYKQIFADGLVGTVIGAGEKLRSHQVRAGIGVRF